MWELTQASLVRSMCHGLVELVEYRFRWHKDPKYRDWGWKTLLAFEPPASERRLCTEAPGPPASVAGWVLMLLVSHVTRCDLL